jgi:hypothetical protein
MKFLRESKESEKANLPFRSLNLTFVQEFGLLREERAFWHRVSAMPKDHYFDTVGSIGHSSGEVPKLN